MSTEPAAFDKDEAIRRRAYEIWQSAGCPDGKDLDHWQQAEREIGLENETPRPEAGGQDSSRRKRPPNQTEPTKTA